MRIGKKWAIDGIEWSFCNELMSPQDLPSEKLVESEKFVTGPLVQQNQPILKL